MDQQKIQTIQSQIDSGELDVRQLDDEQQSALKELIARGVIKAPAGGVSALAADRDVGEAGIIQQAQDANQLSGLQTPFGEIMSERASFELVGDVIGSFTPYLTNRKALVKEVISGVGGEKYKKPTGPDSFRANAFANQTAKFAETLKKIPLVKATRLGRAFAGTIGLLEKATKSGIKLARGELDVVRSGDTAKSLLGTGARTEAKSLVYGAVGAGTGSALYDIAKFKQNLGSNLSMDLGELTTDEIDDLPFAGRLMTHSALAMKNSLMFGAIGTGVGIAASKGFGAAKKSLLGLNSEASMKLAKDAFEKGIPLSPTALADKGIGGFLSRNFFMLFGVTPFIGGAGVDKLKKNMVEILMPNLLKASSSLQPSTTATAIVGQGAIGAESIAKMADNYMLNKDNIDVLYTDLLIKNSALGSPSIIPTDNFRKTLRENAEKIMGTDQSQFKAFLQGELATKNLNPEVKKRIAEMLPLATAEQLLSKEYLNVFEAAQYRRFLSGLKDSQMRKGETGRSLAQQITEIQGAMDLDMSLAETYFKTGDIPKTADMQNFINMQKGATTEAKTSNAMAAIKTLSESIHDANDTYFKLVNAFDSSVLKNQFQTDQLLASALFNAGEGVNTQQAFNTLFTATFKQKNAQSLKQLKSLLGVNEATPKGEYANAFMKKIGVRFMFDSFNDAFRRKGLTEGFAPPMMLNENLGKAEGVVRQILEDKPELAQHFKKLKDPNATLVDSDLFAKLNAKDKNGKPIFDDVDRAKIEESLQTSVDELKLSEDAVQDFDIAKFRQNLGVDDAGGYAMLEELYGKEHAKNIAEVVNIMQAGVNIGITDPSTFIVRRIVLSGTAAAGIGAGLGFFSSGSLEGTGLGFGTGLLSAFAARKYGSWIADPNTTKAALGLFSEQERKFLTRGFGPDGPVGKKIYTRGLNSVAGFSKKEIEEIRKGGPALRDLPFGSGPFGLIDPSQPLGKYYGVKRARNLAIMMNYIAGTPGDTPQYTAENITIKDITDYFDQVEGSVQIPNPEVSIAQLPDKTIMRMYPEYAAFKKLSVEDKKIFNDELKAKLEARKREDMEEDQLDSAQNPQAPASPNPAPVNVAQKPPAPIPDRKQQAAAQNLNLNLGSNYANLFPQDEIGQAIAQRKQG